MNPEELADFLVAEVRRYVGDANEAQAARLRAECAAQIAALPTPELGPPGQDGKDIDPEAVRETIRNAVVAASMQESMTLRALVADHIRDGLASLPAGRQGEPGRKGDPGDPGMKGEHGKDGVTPDLEAISQAMQDMMRGMVQSMMAEIDATMQNRMDAIEQGLMTAMPSTIAMEVAKQLAAAMATLPAPAPGTNGKDADPLEVATALEPLVARHVGAAIKLVPAGEDGVSVTGALVNRDGNLVLTLSTGATVDVGRVVGKDAESAAPGVPGHDGLGFDDLNVEHDGERTITLIFQRGDQVKRFPIVIPVVLERGVYSEGRTYERGDGVTWAGCYWIAQAKTTEKPGDGKTDWRLSVKKGRDGKDLTKP